MDQNGLDIWSYILEYSIMSIVIFKNYRLPLQVNISSEMHLICTYLGALTSNFFPASITTQVTLIPYLPHEFPPKGCVACLKMKYPFRKYLLILLTTLLEIFLSVVETVNTEGLGMLFPWSSGAKAKSEC